MLLLTHGYSEFKQEVSVYPYSWIHSVVCLYVINQINRLRHIQVNDIIHFLAQSIILLVIEKKYEYLWKKRKKAHVFLAHFFIYCYQNYMQSISIFLLFCLWKIGTHNFTENIWKCEFFPPRASNATLFSDGR